MRNYITTFWTRLDSYDDPYPTSLQQNWYIGVTQSAAHDLAASFVPQFSGFPHNDLIDLGLKYLLLNRSLIIAIFSAYGGTATGFVGGVCYAALTQFEVVEDVEPTESPRRSPWGYKSEGGGGISNKTASGKGGTFRISLLNYLLLLLNTWEGVSAGRKGFIAGTGQAPKRWIDWLTLLISHYDRYTPTQIYGFLALVDFTKPTFKV